jgi:hypothetical protein
VTLTTKDGLSIAGWYVPSRNRAALIVFPGRDGPVPHARMLVRHGYGVLLLDRRGEGESDGDYNPAAGAENETSKPVSRSWAAAPTSTRSGSAVSACRSVASFCCRPRRRITACGRSSQRARAGNRSTIRCRSLTSPRRSGGCRRRPSRRQPASCSRTTCRRAGWSTSCRASRPRRVLLIMGGQGNADEELNPVYQDAGGSTVSLWRIPQAGHTGVLSAVPDAYETRVVEFFDHTLLGRLVCARRPSASAAGRTWRPRVPPAECRTAPPNWPVPRRSH